MRFMEMSPLLALAYLPMTCMDTEMVKFMEVSPFVALLYLSMTFMV